ncbi:MAG: hypothetical protein P4L10_15100 [Acidobacteriaceae bacterium]|nr:hypothetical protein [Acidobacteriaceae bacterium]
MKRRLLWLYQVLTGLSDGSTGVMLLFAPVLTLRLMGVSADVSALPYLQYIGAFVLSTGVACLYGAVLAGRAEVVQRLETVWLLTAITRGLVAVFVAWQVLDGSLEWGWLTVAATDGALALLQAIGLMRGWLTYAAA